MDRRQRIMAGVGYTTSGHGTNLIFIFGSQCTRERNSSFPFHVFMLYSMVVQCTISCFFFQTIAVHMTCGIKLDCCCQDWCYKCGCLIFSVMYLPPRMDVNWGLESSLACVCDSNKFKFMDNYFTIPCHFCAKIKRWKKDWSKRTVYYDLLLGLSSRFL